MSSIAIKPIPALPAEGISGFQTWEPMLRHSRQKLALAIPTFCEAENIPALLTRVRAVLDPLEVDCEILIIDDDSCDGTAEIVSAMALVDRRVRLLVRKGQRGLSGAILHGWQHTDASIVGVMDADLQHPPELLPELIATLSSGFDLAIGSRYVDGGALGGWNPLRKLLSTAAVWATLPLQRVSLSAKDPMSGYFVVRRECLDGIEFQETGFKLLLEILTSARIQSVKEVPFAFGERYRGASKASLKVAFDFGRLLARLYSARFSFRRLLPLNSTD
jgi:dolichol-phosphate mannosyltransferase